jgi:hypothetical protein
MNNKDATLLFENLYGCECDVLKWISCPIKHVHTLHFEITSYVTYNEAFGSPNTLNVRYIHPLAPKPLRAYTQCSKLSNFSNRIEETPNSKFSDQIRFFAIFCLL